MDLKQTLENQLKEAMRAGDTARKNTLRMVLTNIKLAEVEKGDHLDDTGIYAIIQKEIKSRRESIQDAERANRPDLIDAANVDIKILEEYLPKPLTDSELNDLVLQTIKEVGASSPADTGKVMKALLARVQGRAAGDRISLAVRQVLSK